MGLRDEIDSILTNEYTAVGSQRVRVVDRILEAVARDRLPRSYLEFACRSCSAAIGVRCIGMATCSNRLNDFRRASRGATPGTRGTTT